MAAAAPWYLRRWQNLILDLMDPPTDPGSDGSTDGFSSSCSSWIQQNMDRSRFHMWARWCRTDTDVSNSFSLVPLPELPEQNRPGWAGCLQPGEDEDSRAGAQMLLQDSGSVLVSLIFSSSSAVLHPYLLPFFRPLYYSSSLALISPSEMIPA